MSLFDKLKDVGLSLDQLQDEDPWMEGNDAHEPRPQLPTLVKKSAPAKATPLGLFSLDALQETDPWMGAGTRGHAGSHTSDDESPLVDPEAAAPPSPSLPSTPRDDATAVASDSESPLAAAAPASTPTSTATREAVAALEFHYDRQALQHEIEVSPPDANDWTPAQPLPPVEAQGVAALDASERRSGDAVPSLYVVPSPDRPDSAKSLSRPSNGDVPHEDETATGAGGRHSWMHRARHRRDDPFSGYDRADDGPGLASRAKVDFGDLLARERAAQGGGMGQLGRIAGVTRRVSKFHVGVIVTGVALLYFYSTVSDGLGP